jgi:hypothetical protein
VPRARLVGWTRVGSVPRKLHRSRRANSTYCGHVRAQPTATRHCTISRLEVEDGKNFVEFVVVEMLNLIYFNVES